jgi:phosphatidylinositol N-acetylglucosaminyltransferase subunit A
MDLGPFAGPIYTAILLVDCLFFLFLEWWMPREDLHFVHHHWNPDVFTEVCLCLCHCILFRYVLTF